jgi:hypothetical protein
MADIPYLRGKLRAHGRAVAWNWSPSPRLRALGWTNRFLGDGPPPARPRQKPRPPGEIAKAAIALNDKLEEWERGNAEAEAALPAPPPPRRWTFQDLVDAYRASDAYRTEIAPATRKEYDLRLRQLAFWAHDGALPVAAIDRALAHSPKDKVEAAYNRAQLLDRRRRVLERWAELLCGPTA